MQAYVFHLMQAYVLQIFCRPPLLKKCMAIEKFKMLPFTRLQAFEGPLFLQNSVTNKNLRCSIHICNRTVLCSWNPTWNICTFHNTLICSYTWPAVHNFVQQSHLLSSRPATVHRPLSIPTPQQGENCKYGNMNKVDVMDNIVCGRDVVAVMDEKCGRWRLILLWCEE